ncbi:NADH-dependent fumarate reductase [Tribonema minus]|uniref:fumarate reductase (NADH) n=1 Tax=Tribonema minus TaxID=303371 RepID=A0A835YME9_9STRA|nr:NADH-dependent fumarate reductase [Tribonema minus]
MRRLALLAAIALATLGLSASIDLGQLISPMLQRLRKILGPATATTSAPAEVNPVVAVVGGGLAGLAAAIEAYEAGATVYLFDKAKSLGGNSAKATSGINGAETSVQRDKGIQDKVEMFHGDVIRSGAGRSVPALVDVVAGRSADAVEWLMGDRFGLGLTAIAHCGGHSAPRTHRLPPLPDGRPVPVGFTTIKAVQGYLSSRPERVNIVTNAEVTRLLVAKDGAVTGLSYRRAAQGGGKGGQGETVEVAAGAVVLATGGYAFDRSPASLLSKYAPDKLHLATTSGPQATGDGVRLAEDLGAALVDMDQIQVHPTALVDPKDPTNLSKFLGPETMRGEGGILVDGTGKRFTNELATRIAVTEAIFKHGRPATRAADGSAVAAAGGVTPTVAFLIMNGAVAEKFGRGMLGFYKGKGLVTEVEDAAAAAALIGTDAATLAATLQQYARDAHAGAADAFGKVTFPVKDFSPDEPLFVAIITPAIHYTMGGVAIDAAGRVLRNAASGSAQEPIPRLFAAGEVSGGVHGGNRLAGNSLLECVVMGRVAGREAAAVALAGGGSSSGGGAAKAEL